MSKAKYTILLALCIGAFLTCYRFALHLEASPPQVTHRETVPATQRTPQKPRLNTKRASNTQVPKEPSLSVFDDTGAIDTVFAKQYNLSQEQTRLIENAKTIALNKIRILDAKNFKAAVPPNNSPYWGHVNPYPAEGENIKEEYYSTLRAVLGEDNFRDFEKRQSIRPSESANYEIFYAGILYKYVSFDNTHLSNGKVDVLIKRELRYPREIVYTPQDNYSDYSTISGVVGNRSELAAKFDEMGAFLVDIAPDWLR